MDVKPRTELGDITPIGAELDESALSTLNGGMYDDEQCKRLSWYDPPGICTHDY
ncbi:hypothetical protein [Nonomuraea sp. NPDC001023]|uniref:hypothetical protein n=1 Tax=unclassified Nonomuraea TaxID=2593643 RepID=UPI00332CB71D